MTSLGVTLMKKITNLICEKLGINIDQSVFDKNREEIQKANLGLLRNMTFIAGILAVFIFVLDFIYPEVIQNDNMYFMLFMASAILFALTYIAFNPLLPYSTILAYFFSTVVAAFSAIIGLYETPAGVSALFMVVLAILPMQIIDKQTHVIPYTIAVWLAFCVCAIIMKEKPYAVADMIYASTALVAGILINRLVFKSRLSSINNNRVLSRHTQIDSISGLPNYKKFNDDLSGKSDSRISKSLCSLAVFDIDLFKEYNTKYGREAGDKCLKKIGNCFLRISDPGELIIYRYGGTSFVAVSLIHDYKGIERVCKGILALVRNLNIEFQGSPSGIITMSAGYADVVECECDEFEKLVDMANQCIEYARKDGGNQGIGYIQLKNTLISEIKISHSEQK